MKRTTIALISIVIGLSFFGLLMLQARIVQAMATMRKGQFDEAVFRALDQTSRDLERNETFRYLQQAAQQMGLNADSTLADASLSTYTSTAWQGYMQLDTTPISATIAVAQPQQRTSTLAPQLPSGLGMRHYGTVDDASMRFREFVKNAYLYRKGVLDEVVYTILYTASEKALGERINFRLLDSNLRAELESSGITLEYHFSVADSRGQEVFRCVDFDSTGIDYTYTQTLFRNDPLQKMGVLRVHFPERTSYIMGAASAMIPSLVFTLILFFTFCFTVWLIVRQKRDTEMKNDFINNMTHEFKTPISSISLAAQMLGDKSVAKSPAMIDNLSGVIVSETRRLRYQVEKVLQMSLYENGNIRFNEKEIDANVVIDDVVHTFTLKVKQSGGSLTANLDAEDAAIYVDEMHFTNVVFNLLDNAVKYRRDDEPLQLNVTTANQSSRLIITVSDNGIGIKRDDLRRIFDRFYRVHTGNKHDVKGFGLGLSYVKTMIELMHGTIKAESEPSRGTTFIISLPLID